VDIPQARALKIYASKCELLLEPDAREIRRAHANLVELDAGCVESPNISVFEG
jgi:hypothetical protein